MQVETVEVVGQPLRAPTDALMTTDEPGLSSGKAEWNLIGQLFDASTAERYDLINRICTPAELAAEVDALVAVMSAKNPVTVRRSKFALNKGADLPLSGAMAFEIPIRPFANHPGRFATAGMEDFAKPESRAARRKVSKSFWQER